MKTYYIGSIPVSDELYHHGIKGQKWGIRRWQNEDGSLTAAGKAKYGTVENFNRAQAMKKARSDRDNAVARAAVRGSGLAYNLTKSGRDKTRNAFDEAKRAQEDYKKAKGIFDKSNKTKTVQNAKNSQKRTNAKNTQYGRDVANSLLKAAGYGALSYLNWSATKNTSSPRGLRFVNASMAGLTAGYAVRSLGEAAGAYGRHWAQKIQKAEKEAKKEK